MYTLFDTVDKNEKLNVPLAERMRPETLKGFLGQIQIAGEGSLLKRAIIADKLGSCIFLAHRERGKLRLLTL